MKRKLFYGFIALTLVASLTGCGKEEKNSEKAAFTITCVGEKDDSVGFETQNSTTYNFNSNQYVIGYSVTTTQKFEDSEVYNMYKSAQEGTVSDNSEENISYELKSDDEKMTLVFTMSIKNIDVEDADTEEEKENYKASAVLSSSRALGNTCTVDGIDESKLN